MEVDYHKNIQQIQFINNQLKDNKKNIEKQYIKKKNIKSYNNKIIFNISKSFNKMKKTRNILL